MTRHPPYRGPRLFSQGFRPFFLAASAWAALAPALWLGVLDGWFELNTVFDPVSWHIHEMIFGFVVATIAGFLSAAIPNWTGRLPVRGAPLICLAALWLAGRAAVAASVWLGAGLTAAIDLSFLATLLIVVLRELIAGKNWRNLPMAGALAALLGANAAMHAEAAGWLADDGTSWRLAVSVVVILISLVGGRIVPSFTRNWLAKNGFTDLPSAFGHIDRLAQATTIIALALWTALPGTLICGIVLLAAGAAQGVRVMRWRGLSATGEPLVLILHVAYLWAPIGLALLGVATLAPGVSSTLAIHALTLGLVGGMILAVMTRATLGHTGRPLRADRFTISIYVAVNAAALARIAAEINSTWMIELINLSGFFWVAAFAGFAIYYGRFLVGVRRE